MSSTLRDVARLAGVSVRTVSNVISDRPHTSQATRSRVHAAAAELGYRPNALARALRARASDPLALYLAHPDRAEHQQVLSDLLRVAEGLGLQTTPPVGPGVTAPVCLLLRPTPVHELPVLPAPGVTP